MTQEQKDQPVEEGAQTPRDSILEAKEQVVQPGDSKGLPVEELKKVLEEEKSKAEQYLANWQRAQADFINYRRRADQEKSDTLKFANAMLVSSLLPVLDDFERAFDSISSKLAGLTWVDGVKLIYRKLQAVLDAQGLVPMETTGQDFDPRLHEAVLYGDGEEGKIIEELQRGYKFHDRVIRPAMVKVGKGNPNSVTEDEVKGQEGGTQPRE